MFPWKSITKIPVPIFSKSSEKVGVGILVIDFQASIFMSSHRFQNLLNKFLFNLKRHSTLCDLPFQSYDQSKMSKNVTVWQEVNPTLVESKNVERKNAENKNEGVDGDLWVRVRARKVSPIFSTFIFSAFLSFDIFTFDQIRVNRSWILNTYFIDTVTNLTWFYAVNNLSHILFHHNFR
jgi:hypothetical protein